MIPNVSSNLPIQSYKLKIKEGYESEIQIWTSGRQFKFIKS